MFDDLLIQYSDELLLNLQKLEIKYYDFIPHK